MFFDMVIAGDFRFGGGTSAAICHEIDELLEMGYKIGLLATRAPVIKIDRPWNAAVVRRIDNTSVSVIESGAEVNARFLVCHNPYAFMDRDGLGHGAVTAERRIIVAHQPACNAEGDLYFDPWYMDRLVRERFGGMFVWAPISPVCRESFQNVGFDRPLLKKDWRNIIKVDDWGQAREAPSHEAPTLGRHSRPEWDKWPKTRKAMLSVYPGDDPFRVRILGGGNWLENLAGPYPPNWDVVPFGGENPREFLKTIDYFVYFHHPDRVEAFGRTIGEAIGAGCVVILPEYLRKTFGGAATYCAPCDVAQTVLQIHQTVGVFGKMSSTGRRVLTEMYGTLRYRRMIAWLEEAANKPGWGDIAVEEINHDPLRRAWLRARYVVATAVSKNVVGRLWRKTMKRMRH